MKITKCSSRTSLLTIYKSFIRPHFDCGNISYDQAYNSFFQQKTYRAKAMDMFFSVLAESSQKVNNFINLTVMKNYSMETECLGILRRSLL